MSASAVNTDQLEAWSAVALTVVTVILAVLSIAVALMLWRVNSFKKNFKKKLKVMKEQSQKNSHLFFAISNIAIANIPRITFTQQVPSMVVESMGIIDKIFSNEKGNEFWNYISRISEPTTFARIAYLRAVYRIATKASTREMLLEDEWSAVRLLELEPKNTDLSALPVDLFGDILVRKCQALRQAGRPEDLNEAEGVAKRLYGMSRRFQYGEVQLFGPWCLALVYLQRASLQGTRAERAGQFLAAAEILQPLYDRGFGSRPGMTSLRQKEMGSFAYYMAKALWSARMSSPVMFEDAIKRTRDIGVRLRRSVIVSMGLLEIARSQQQADPCIAAIYHFCVALVIAVALELPETHDSCVADRHEVFEKLDTHDKLRAHALECLNQADEIAKEVASNSLAGGINFIYCERNERLDTIPCFIEDINWVRNALELTRKNPLSNFYQEETL